MSCRIAEGSLSLCVVLLMFGTSSLAQEGPSYAPSSTPADVMPGDSWGNDGQAPCPNCPAQPAGGDGWEGAGSSFPHFPLPSRSYSLFRSPATYGWGYRERCAPSAFTPRGHGIPFRTSCYRMDYRPYELEHDSSKHGPAYYQRHNLQPCVDCDGRVCRPQCYNATQY